MVLWWMAGEKDRIGAQVATAIDAADAGVVVSAVSVWEVAIKQALGKLEAPTDLLAQLERAGVELISISARHADLVGSLPPHHGDPFDRLLVAQAMIEGLTLVSGDEQMRSYEIEVLW